MCCLSAMGKRRGCCDRLRIGSRILRWGIWQLNYWICFCEEGDYGAEEIRGTGGAGIGPLLESFRFVLWFIGTLSVNDVGHSELHSANSFEESIASTRIGRATHVGDDSIVGGTADFFEGFCGGESNGEAHAQRLQSMAGIRI